MIDSIQTMNFTDLNSSPGSVTQVRECTNAIMRCSKSLDIPAILVGHVNKDGAIAGPKVLEHIVDAVLYFEGDRQMTYRILRAVKNRYGSTNEIGVFDMGGSGAAADRKPLAGDAFRPPDERFRHMRNRRNGGYTSAARGDSGSCNNKRLRHAAPHVHGL